MSFSDPCFKVENTYDRFSTSFTEGGKIVISCLFETGCTCSTAAFSSLSSSPCLIFIFRQDAMPKKFSLSLDISFHIKKTVEEMMLVNHAPSHIPPPPLFFFFLQRTYFVRPMLLPSFSNMSLYRLWLRHRCCRKDRYSLCNRNSWIQRWNKVKENKYSYMKRTRHTVLLQITPGDTFASEATLSKRFCLIYLYESTHKEKNLLLWELRNKNKFMPGSSKIKIEGSFNATELLT